MFRCLGCAGVYVVCGFRFSVFVCPLFFVPRFIRSVFSIAVHFLFSHVFLCHIVFHPFVGILVKKESKKQGETENNMGTK